MSCGCEKEPEESASACCQKPAEEPEAVCCQKQTEETSCCQSPTRVDWLLLISLVLLLVGLVGQLLDGGASVWQDYCQTVGTLFAKAWWGILAGMLAVGLLSRVPRELIACVLGRGGTFSGVVRAMAAGTLLDLCNHGVLMVGMQIYRKGASLGQTIAFLVSSPWNSFSLTLILFALIGWKWTLVFIALSMLIGLVAGLLADRLVSRQVLPTNPNEASDGPAMSFRTALAEAWPELRPNLANLHVMARASWTESQMILRWVFFGFVLAALIHAFTPDEWFASYFGPSMLGLFLTLLATTVIEVCSEGSSPIAADLLQRAGAPGNAFTFLMAGAATDYTEILVLRETTRSWKATLALPLLTVPQVLAISWVLNQW